MSMQRTTLATLGTVLGVLILPSTRATADETERTGATAFHADAEIDPFAYAFNGYSLHVGVGYRSLRVALSAFALDMPSFLEPDENFQSARNGYGIKVQYFPFAEQGGGFFGVQAELAHELIESQSSDAAHRERTVNLGINLGWRFLFGDFFVTPWLLLNYTVGAEDIPLDGNTYEASTFFPIPTVHIGYRFL